MHRCVPTQRLVMVPGALHLKEEQWNLVSDQLTSDR